MITNPSTFVREEIIQNIKKYDVGIVKLTTLSKSITFSQLSKNINDYTYVVCFAQDMNETIESKTDTAVYQFPFLFMKGNTEPFAISYDGSNFYPSYWGAANINSELRLRYNKIDNTNQLWSSAPFRNLTVSGKTLTINKKDQSMSFNTDSGGNLSRQAYFYFNVATYYPLNNVTSLTTVRLKVTTWICLAWDD